MSLFRDQQNQAQVQETAEMQPTIETASQAMAPVGQKAIATQEQINAMFSVDENMVGTEPRLPSIKVLSQGQMFEMPDGSKKEIIEGVIIDSNRVNAFWEEAFSGEGTAPDCSSFDGIKPHCENPLSRICAECSKNKYGSDGNRGKACKNMRRVHVLLNGDRLPHRLTLPPTSLRGWDDFMVSLSNQNIPYPAIISVISLEKAKNKDGISYSSAKFSVVEAITDIERLQAIKKMRAMLAEQMQRESIIADEFGATDEAF